MRGNFEKEAIFALTQYVDSPYRLGSAFVIPNSTYFGHECDFLIISKADYATEIELKATVSDLKADKKKPHAHKSNYIRQLYFGISEDIPLETAREHIPEHAGIIRFFRLREGQCSSLYVGQLRSHIVRKPKPNKTALKLTEEQKRDLLKSVYYRYYSLLFREKWKEINQRVDNA